jgi:hypothetical protein
MFGDDCQLITLHERSVPDQGDSSRGEMICKSFVKRNKQERAGPSWHGTNRSE